MPDRRTIFAVSTAPGRAGIAVIRVSGPEAGSVVQRLAPPLPTARQAAFRSLRHPESGDLLDRAVVLFFAGPASETGEDVAEFQTHGGPAVVRSVLDAIAAIPGCRMAEPGEFVRRAFDNGKLDLIEAEGLADLIDADTDAQRRQALGQATGALSHLYEDWRRQLIQATALVEAGIDFSDEQDVANATFEQARERVAALDTAIRAHLADGHRGEILRDGFRVVLAGPPNAGKSSLLNALARRDVAIVSEEAGTTRDVIEVRLDLDGLPVIVSDTAGIREAQGKVEQEGIRRTLERAREADLVLWLIDATWPVEPPASLSPEWRADDRRRRVVRILSKADLGPDHRSKASLALSSKTGSGIDELTRLLADAARDTIGSGESPALTRARHRHLLEDCSGSLADFLAGDPAAIELRAEDLRLAAHALGRITGHVDVEDVLDQIFGRFCIGK